MKAYEVITDRIVAALEEGVAPWRQPWNVVARGTLRNAISKHEYRGINVPMLALSARAAGYADPRWLTFRQAKQAGGSVRRGERGTPVVFWTWIEKADPDDNDEVQRFPVLRLYTVFNVEQCDGLTLEPLPQPEPNNIEPIDTAECIVSGYQNGPRIEHGGNAAYYRPSADVVRMPKRTAFESAERYYGVLFHELTHSTGHESRLARFDTGAPLAAFGSADYSREELVAEFGAAFCAGAAGVDLVQPSASYVNSWLRVLRNDKKIVVHTAAQAQKATDHILGRNTNDGY